MCVTFFCFYLSFQKDNNLTLADWISDEVYDKIKAFNERKKKLFLPSYEQWKYRGGNERL